MHCPACGDEYRHDVLTCVDCGMTLVPGPASPGLAVLGRFHPDVLDAVVAVARQASGRVETLTREVGVDVLVEREARDHIRAQLVLAWPRLLAGLEEAARGDASGLGSGEEAAAPDISDLPGWFDPPESLWVDRSGALQAGWTHEETVGHERSLGPALMAIGGLLLVAAWYLGGDSLRLTAAVLGAGILLVGWFMPR